MRGILWGRHSSSGEFSTGFATDREGLVVVVTGRVDAFKWLNRDTECLCATWSKMTVLKFKPLWKGVEVVRWFEEARWKEGVSTESRSWERSVPGSGVAEREVVGCTLFTGELCLATDTFLL